MWRDEATGRRSAGRRKKRATYTKERERYYRASSGEHVGGNVLVPPPSHSLSLTLHDKAFGVCTCVYDCARERAREA